MTAPEHRSITNAPDETREAGRGHYRFLKLEAGTVALGTLRPGWRWSVDSGAGEGASCQAPHFSYILAGRLGVRMDDGTEFVAGPGDVIAIPPGHDAWVVGEDVYQAVDWSAATAYGRTAG